MPGGHVELPDVDPWAPVSFDHLPSEVVAAFERQDWGAVRAGLRDVMDGVTTDGPYGRALHQLVRQLPIGVDPLFDRYRAIVDLDLGDWDDLRRCLESRPLEPFELIGLRDVIVAPIGRRSPPRAEQEHQAVWFGLYDFRFQYAIGANRRLAKRMLNYHPDVSSREDVALARHVRYRALQDVMILGCNEAQAGCLDAAEALAREAQRLGDPREAFHVLAYDIEALVRVAAGRASDANVRLPLEISRGVGSPLAIWELLFYSMPLYAVLPTTDALGWAVRLMERVTERLGSPRGQFIAECWRVGLQLLDSPRNGMESELAGLVARARHAAPGLRAFAELLAAVASREPSRFVQAERSARLLGNTWMQLSALVWSAALNPSRWTLMSLQRLLRLTGWRRVPFVPRQIAGDAALGLTAAGLRGPEIVELALVADRPNITLDVAQRHLDDPRSTVAARDASLSAIAKLGTTRSRELLHRASRRGDEAGVRARSLLGDQQAGGALTDREVEVLDLAGRGLTNKEIAARLFLSQHTVARHLANSREKLGAANRTEAATKLVELGSTQDR